MTKNNSNRIAVHFDDMVEFYNIRHGVDALMEAGIPVDLIVSAKHSEMHSLPGKQELMDETYYEIVKHGYSPVREIDESIRYKILLEPHLSEKYYLPEKINHEFRIKYMYYLIQAKPKNTCTFAKNIEYDAILCHTKREAEMLSAYTKTFLISPMRYKGFKKDLNRPSEKQTLLYAPTFGNIGSIDSIEEAVSTLKKEYYVVVKAHHMTQTRETERFEILKSIADEYYSQAVDLAELLQSADVMLSDNSAAIFDAIYAEVPVAIYNRSEDLLNDMHLGRIDTYQYQLVKRGVIPYTNSIDKIGDVLKEAVKCREKQSDEKADFLTEEDMTKAFVETIKHFLDEDRNNNEYYALLDVIRDTYHQQITRANDLENELSDLRNSKAFKLGRALTKPYRAVVKSKQDSHYSF